jgi:hypothetical protein
MENSIYMSKMVCPGFSIDGDIIKKNKDKMMEKRTKDMIHETLEGGGGITQDKGHDQKIIVALLSYKGSIGNVFLFHTYLVVAQMNIQFNKNWALLNSSKRSSMTGMGNLSLMVCLLRAQKSRHIH